MLLACKPAVLDLVGDTGARRAPSGDSGDDTTPIAADDSGDDGGDDGGDDTGWPVGWSGTRSYAFSEGCEGTLGERGDELLEGTEGLQTACPACDRFFLLSVSPEAICDLAVATPTWRGLSHPGGDTVGIWFLHDSDAGWIGEHAADTVEDGDDEYVYELSGEVAGLPYVAAGWFWLYPQKAD